MKDQNGIKGKVYSIRLFQGLFLFLISLIIAEEGFAAGADRGKKIIPEASSKKEARVEGFRSARFGMSEKEILKAIYKDFRISKKNVERQVHPTEKTVNLGIFVENLLSGTGPSRVYYVFGYESKRLIQVNVVWGKAVAKEANPNEVVNLANQLRIYFAGKKFKQEGLVMNAPVGEDTILVFRGSDVKGRMVLLLLNNPKKPEGPANQEIVLKLSYIQKPGKPDVFRIQKGKF